MQLRQAWSWVVTHARRLPSWARRCARSGWEKIHLWGIGAGIAAGAIAVITLAALLWLFTDWYVRPTQPSERTAALQVAAQIVGGIVLLLGLAATAWNVAIGREGQITERFGRAIDQLGSDKLDVRLGGIYSLERIARDSRRDYRPIVEVLTAYVRTRAPLPEARMAAWRSENPIRALHELPPTEAQRDPAVDVQAALTVLSRRRALAGGGSLDLHGCDLANVVMGKADLRKAAL